MNVSGPLTPTEFTAWYAGFIAALDGEIPTLQQWEVLRETCATTSALPYHRITPPRPVRETSWHELMHPPVVPKLDTSEFYRV